MSKSRIIRQFLRHHQGGASAVEFAILAPVFLLMLVGMLAYGIYFGAAHAVQQIAADAARTSVAGLSNTERNTLVKAYLINNAGNYMLIDASALTYKVGDSTTDPNQYVVTVTYDAKSLPIWNFADFLPLPSQIIRFSSSIRHGGI